jgi:uncharacterized protein with GYD domain
MKSKSLSLAAIILMTGVVLVGNQKTSARNIQSARESMGEAKPDSQATYSHEWQEFKSTSEQKIQDNENRIAAFREKMEKSGTKMKAKYNREIANLEKANRGMKKKLEEYKNDGKTAWADFKTRFNNEMDKIGKALKDLTSDSQATYSEEWQQFKRESAQKIQDNENSIMAFKEKMKKSGTKMEAKYNKEIANLEKANRRMKRELEGYKYDGKTAWEKFKTGFNNDMNKIGKELKDLTSDND